MTNNDSHRNDDDGGLSVSFQTEDHHSVVSKEEKIAIAVRENLVVRYLKVVLILVLLLVATLVSGFVYGYAHNKEHSDFENAFYNNADKVTSSFLTGSAQRLTTIENFAMGITASAKDRGEVWPLVTVPEFTRKAAYTIELAKIMSIAMLSVVTNETRSAWEPYSVANQGWHQEGLDYYEVHKPAHFNQTLDDESILNGYQVPSMREYILNITSGQSDTSDGPYLVWWQFAPNYPDWTLVNYNGMSHPTRKGPLDAIMKSQTPIVSKAFDYADVTNPQTIGKKALLNIFLNRNRWNGEMKGYQDGPVSDLYFPVYEDNDNELDDPRDRKMVAVLTAYVYWQIYFDRILPQNARGMIAVLENSCGQAFTYRIDGEDATYIGAGDLHDPKYDAYQVSTGFNAFIQKSADLTVVDETSCSYNVRVYPTQDMEDDFITNNPLHSTIVVACVFIFTSLVFLLYDGFVEKRQRLVMKKAVESTEVVNTLFPEAVRKRMFEENEQKNNGQKKVQDGEEVINSLLHNTENGPKLAIADVYENCTVMFADLAGFTEWSSGRTPTHVFALLENVYGEFDEIAKRMGVFKVETIGDCYLAITGVPRPQKKHALVMTHFACECLMKLDLLIHTKLVPLLGAGTASLQMRVGLHSGPVTAGVLRGDRARFQLFGDTVNTAARMEHTGVPGRIQVSSETAKILVAARKEGWLIKRDGGVEAKGKGMLESYFIDMGAIVQAESSVVSGFAPGDTVLSTGSSSDADEDIDKAPNGINGMGDGVKLNLK